MVRRAALVLFAGALSACLVRIDFSDTQYQCPTGECPNGFDCVAGQCIAEGAGPDASPSDQDGGTEPAVACGDPALIRADFEASDFPWWLQYDELSPPTIINGRLRIDAPTMAETQSQVGDAFHMRLEGNRLSVEVTQIIAAEPQIAFVEIDSAELGLQGSTLVGKITFGNMTTTGSTPFDATAHRFWSIVESDGVVALEASPDGVDWTTVHSRTVSVTPDFGHFNLEVHSLGVAGFVEYDNVNGGGAPATEACLPSLTSETFDDASYGPDYAGYEFLCAKTVSGGTMTWALSNEGGAQPSCGLDARFRYDMRNSSFGLEMLDYADSYQDIYHNLVLRADGGEALIYVTVGEIVAEYCDPTCRTLGVADLDATAHRFWRIRHDGGLHIELSPDSTDSSSWTVLGSVSEPFDVSISQLEFRFGSDLPSSESIEIDNYGPMP